jgi:photosynthetic reaction center cytochrome c subunit
MNHATMDLKAQRPRGAATGWLTAALLGLAVLATGCERLPMESTQLGYRGTGMVQIDNPRILAAAAAARPEVPASTPVASPDGPKAKDVFQNVKVLGDLSVGEFTRTMVAMTAWVAPEAGCDYCHAGANLADDSKYQKVVARRMIEMNRHLNTDWNAHVGKTGVTCYTCHRGQNVPAQTWQTAAPGKRSGPGSLLGNDFGQNKGVPAIAGASLPYDPFTGFLDGKGTIRVNGPKALPSGYTMPIQAAEKTYSLMNHISKSLGVNCTFCHNTHSFQSWDGPPQRVTAWHGIQMVRDLNVDYLKPLTGTFPAARLGPTGDVAKVYCATCHQGQNKPLGGLAMAPDYPALVASPAAAASAPAQAAALPEPVAEALRSVLYFGVGATDLAGEQAKGLAQLIDTLSKQTRTVATISGYHSSSGALSVNQELAKKRAFSVRDALLAAGIAQSRVRLQRPQQAEANLAGEDPAARRVEVTVR